jgi:phosphatidylglycerol---prolipoprotein diacylglyceryl transferase
MTQLPKVTWDFDPVFLAVPRGLVIGGLAVFTVISLGIGLRKKAGDQLLTALIFGVLTFLAYKYLGPEFELRYYSALFLGVFLGGYSLLKWQIVRGGGRAEDAGDFIVYGVLGVLVGARLGHVLFYDLDHALRDPKWIVMIWTGGLASHGAVIGLITAMWIYCKRRGVPFLEGADRFSFSAALGATLVRLGNLFNSEIIGRKVPDQSWGFWFKRHSEDREAPVYRYPTQLYEIALGLLVLGALFVIDKRLGKERRPRGAMIASFFAIYFSGRFFIEFYKEYEGISPEKSPLTMGQYLSIPGILLGLFGLFWAFRNRLPVGWPNPYADSLPAEEAEGRVGRRKKKKKKVKGKKKRKPEGAPATAAESEGRASDAGSPESEADHDDSDDRLESERPSHDELAREERKAASEDESEAEGDDEEDQDSKDEPATQRKPSPSDADEDADEDDEGEDDEQEPATTRKPSSGDPDVDDEFDADGKLRRR